MRDDRWTAEKLVAVLLPWFVIVAGALLAVCSLCSCDRLKKLGPF